MSKYTAKPIPKPLLKLKSDLEDFRKNKTGNKRLPDNLWKKAAGIAKTSNIGLVSKHLRLDYYSLKKWIKKIEDQKNPEDDFFELKNDTIVSQSEPSTFEFENKLGEKLRIGVPSGNQEKFIKLIEDFLSRSR